MFHPRKKVVVVFLFVGFVFGQFMSPAFAQEDSDVLKKEALVEEELQKQALQKLEQENPEGLTDEELQQGQQELEANEQNLEQRFDQESAQTQGAVDDMLGVGDTGMVEPVERRDLHEEVERRIEEEPATRNSAF
jgi:hypothetical protein